MNIKFIAAVTMIVTAVTACSSSYTDKAEIYDNPDILVSEGDCYSYKERLESVAGEKLSIAFSSFYGKETILRIAGTEGKILRLETFCDLKRGDFKVCIVGPDRGIKTVTEAPGDASTSVEMQDGEYRIIIAGINSYGEIMITKEVADEDL